MKIGDSIEIIKEWEGQIPSPVKVGKLYTVVATHMNPNVVNIIDDEGEELELTKEHWRFKLKEK